MVDNIRKKLLNNHGESIAEVLVAALVIALGSILVVSMINASFRLLTAQENKYKEFISDKNVFEESAYTVDESISSVSISCDDLSLEFSKSIKLYKKDGDDHTFYRYELLD